MAPKLDDKIPWVEVEDYLRVVNFFGLKEKKKALNCLRFPSEPNESSFWQNWCTKFFYMIFVRKFKVFYKKKISWQSLMCCKKFFQWKSFDPVPLFQPPGKILFALQYNLAFWLSNLTFLAAAEKIICRTPVDLLLAIKSCNLVKFSLLWKLLKLTKEKCLELLIQPDTHGRFY